MIDAPLDTPPPKQSRRLRRRGQVMAAITVAAVLLIGALGYLVLSGTPLVVPNWITEKVERRLNTALAGNGRVQVGDIEIAVDRMVPRLRMRDVGFSDSRGVEVGRVSEVGVRLAARPLIRGVLEMHTLAVSGALMTVRRMPDGTFDLRFGGGSGTTGTLASVLDGIERTFRRPPLTQLRGITADGVTISVEDARSGRVWQVTGGRIELEQGADRIKLTVTADVFNGTDELASTVIAFETEKGTPRARMTATFENAAAADIAAQSPALAFLKVLDAPISGGLAGEIGEDGELSGLSGTLEIGSGVLQPVPQAKPIRIDAADAAFAYDAAQRRLSFDRFSLRTAAAEGRGSGQAFLRDFNRGLPGTMVAQFRLNDVSVQPEGLFAEPMTFDQGAVTFRLRLDPFTVEIGELSLTEGERRTLGRGAVSADTRGWTVSLDVTAGDLPLDRILALWPVTVAANTRTWIAKHISTGEVFDGAGAFRLSPDNPRGNLSVSFSFNDASVKPMATLPPITDASGFASLTGSAFTAVLERGKMTAPEGGDVALDGSFIRIPDVTVANGLAQLQLETDSSITAMLSILDLPPFSILSKNDLEPTLADGRAVLNAEIGFHMRERIAFTDVNYTVAGRLLDVYSDVIVPDRVIRSEALELRANPSGVAISGQGRLGEVPANVVWSQPFGPDASGGIVEGIVSLGDAFLEEFNIALPDGAVTGEGIGAITVQLGGGAPTFRLISDLNRLALRFEALDWSKAQNQTGRLEVEGTLGPQPSVDRIALSAPGLTLEGRIDLSATGGLARAVFDKVDVDGWLRGAVTLTGRGPNLAPAVAMNGGVIDMRAASFGGADGGGRGDGETGPISLRLNRLIVTKGVFFTDFNGTFESRGGFQGRFSARINGGAPVTGSLVATPTGSAIRLFGDNAGGILASAGLLKSARGGTLDLTLNPTGRQGLYNGRLAIRNIRIVEAPAITALLSAISIVGLIDQLNTGGITMTEVDADFQLSPTTLSVIRSSGVGPSLGISLDGTYDLASGRVNMHGVISPIYFLNSIGQMFSRRGEGLFGFNFTLRGQAESPQVSVNPLSILTPGMFRELFRAAPPTVRQ